jgi:hypothetical protein
VSDEGTDVLAPVRPRPPRGGPRPGLLVAVAIGALVLLSAGGALFASRTKSHSPAPVPSASPSAVGSPVAGAPPVPSNGVLVGAWVKPPSGNQEAQVPSAVSAFEQLADRRLDIVHNYRTWTDPFPGPAEEFAVQQGSIPMISWGGTKSSEILSGVDDALIKQRADALRDLHAPVFLRWFWEMDRPDSQTRAGSPAQYIAAWNHLRSIFLAEHATNVSWVWCPTSNSFNRGTGPRYYPGDDAVDWICADGYSGGSQSGTRARSFQQVFQTFYDWASRHPKPIMIGEFGVQKGAGDQAQWLRAAADTLKGDFPRIRAIVYFDAERKGAAGGSGLSWSLRDSAPAMAELRSLLKEPYFNTRRLAGVGAG